MTEPGAVRSRVFQTKAFVRFVRRSEIGSAELCHAVLDAERGLISADLGSGIIKQRIARRGAGKSGGYRTLIVFRLGRIAIFVHGFAKNEQDNVGQEELAALKKLAGELLAYDDLQLEAAIVNGTLIEVICNGKSEAVS